VVASDEEFYIGRPKENGGLVTVESGALFPVPLDDESAEAVEVEVEEYVQVTGENTDGAGAGVTGPNMDAGIAEANAKGAGAAGPNIEGLGVVEAEREGVGTDEANVEGAAAAGPNMGGVGVAEVKVEGAGTAEANTGGAVTTEASVKGTVAAGTRSGADEADDAGAAAKVVGTEGEGVEIVIADTEGEGAGTTAAKIEDEKESMVVAGLAAADNRLESFLSNSERASSQ
jgi:hypothetical protein